MQLLLLKVVIGHEVCACHDAATARTVHEVTTACACDLGCLLCWLHPRTHSLWDLLRLGFFVSDLVLAAPNLGVVRNTFDGGRRELLRLAGAVGCIQGQRVLIVEVDIGVAVHGGRI